MVSVILSSLKSVYLACLGGSRLVLIEDLKSTCRPPLFWSRPGKYRDPEFFKNKCLACALFLCVTFFISDEGGGRILEGRELNQLVILATRICWTIGRRLLKSSQPIYCQQNMLTFLPGGSVSTSFCLRAGLVK